MHPGERVELVVSHCDPTVNLFVFVRDFSANVVRKPAVCIRDVCGSLEDDNLRILAEAAKTGGGRSPACNSADDTDLHLVMAVAVITVFVVMSVLSAVTIPAFFMVVVVSAGCVRVIG